MKLRITLTKKQFEDILTLHYANNFPDYTKAHIESESSFYSTFCEKPEEKFTLTLTDEPPRVKEAYTKERPKPPTITPAKPDPDSNIPF